MPKILYPKQAKTCEEQADLLKQRGLIFDREKIIQDLANFGYYHLSAYWYPYKDTSNKKVSDYFIPETSWDKIIGLYEFDRKLRLLVLDAIERIEVALRAQISCQISCKYGPFGYLKKENFHPKFKHAEWCLNTKEVIEHSKDIFIKHFFSKYEDKDPPLWIVLELINLGSLSRLYQGLELEDKKIIANHFQIPCKKLSYRLHTISYTRNICAHHSRLWNRDLIIRESIKNDKFLTPALRNDRIFYILLMLRNIMKCLNNGNDWQQKIEQLIDQFPDNNMLAEMGIPENWQEHPQWR